MNRERHRVPRLVRIWFDGGFSGSEFLQWVMDICHWIVDVVLRPNGSIAIEIDSSAETAAVKLSERIAIALSTPSQISRFGGLSLGESWALVNGEALQQLW
jgi:hypothetical protein